MLTNIAARCEFSYGAMGRVGFLYESMKDQLKWSGLKVKSFIGIVSQVGQVLSMRDEDYQKHRVEHTQMSDEAIAQVFLRAFGDGK